MFDDNLFKIHICYSNKVFSKKIINCKYWFNLYAVFLYLANSLIRTLAHVIHIYIYVFLHKRMTFSVHR